MDVENCEYKVLCEKCVADQYCKWNSESYKCAAVDNSSETISSTSQCPRITYMTKTRDNNSAIIVFGTENLSKLEGNYTCRYSGYGREITTNFKKLGNGTVQCILPQLKALPSFPGCLSMKLSIMFEESPILFDTINFFDCELEATHISCLNENCTVDGFWSSFGPFGEWSSCNQTCGGGHKNRTRYRTCTDPPPSEKGRFCEGPSIDREMQQCNEQECPVHGTWTFFQEFQDWSQCSVTCGGGTQRRVKIRTCITSKIGNETETCNGSAMEQETQSCTFSQCPSDDGVKISILGSAGGSLLLIFCLFSIACICNRRKTIKRMSQIHSSVLQSQTHLEENEDPGRSHYNYITDTIGKSEDEAEVYQEIVELDETDYLTPINATNSTNPENMDINESSLIEHSDHSSNEYYKLKTMRHDNPYSDFNHLPMDETSDDFLSNENNHDTDVH
ncbi:uncharacterized protein LOC133194839 isoform X2 [Saccostrea echinata]|uniref:uncharacterized protein LOC133194839 isoform X2 n=1 Tax=Saccostrea echinata TaxID=191078 RepID=UPI002A8045B1|nr:uncharacterized protein LOC133194839 isoform X2 [Saccostrea echinata]